MNYLTRGLLSVGVAFAGLSMMTGCTVIQDTLNGTGRVVSSDVKAVEKAVTPAKAAPKKKVMTKTTTVQTAEVKEVKTVKAPKAASKTATKSEVGGSAHDVTLGS